MKCRVILDENREEEIVIYAHRRSALIDQIEALVEEGDRELLGYSQKEIVRITPSEVCCFLVECNKVFALIGNERIQVKQRLYVLEELLDHRFVKINQSCIANMRRIKRFDTSVSGTLAVVFENGYRDYVSRRQLKTVKERMGIRK